MMVLSDKKQETKYRENIKKEWRSNKYKELGSEKEINQKEQSVMYE